MDLVAGLQLIYDLNEQNTPLIYQKGRLGLSGEVKDEVKNRVVQQAESLKLIMQYNSISNSKQSHVFCLPFDSKNISLSFIQRSIYLHCKRLRDTNSYIVPVVLEANLSDISLKRLCKTMQKLLERYPVLRSKISPNATLELFDNNEVDIPIVNLAEADEEEWLKRNWQPTMSIDNGLLVNFQIAVLEQSNRVLISLSHHHIIEDAYSADLLVQKLKEFYTVSERVKTAKRLKTSLNYFDYVRYQNHCIGTQKYQAYLNRLAERLTTMEPITFTTDNQIDPGNAGVEVFEISLPDFSRLVKESSKSGHSLYVLLLAGFYLTIAKYYRKRNFLIRTTISTRIEGTEEEVGPFINSLPVFGVSENDVGALRNEISNQVYALLDHVHLPLEVVFNKAKEMCEDFDTLSPQVMFTMHNYALPKPETHQGELFRYVMYKDTVKARFPMLLTAFQSRDKLSFKFEYDENLFNRDFIKSFVESYLFITRQLGDKALKKVVDFAVLPTEKIERQLKSWNQTKQDYPSDKTLIDLFEQAVIQAPTAVALVYGARQLTYQELDKRANQLAHLIKKETGLTNLSNEVIGLRMERCLEMVVGIYGILKAGAAYLPLEPSYPEDRQAFMIQESGARLVVDMQSFVDLDYYPTANPGRTTEPDDLAYVIYTSGSTGKPKGVMLSHRGAVNRIDWMQKQYRLTTQDTVLQKTPFSFDVSVWEFVWPLVTGSRLVVAEPEGHKDPIYLANLIKARQITTLHFVPSMLRAFLEASPVEELLSIRQVFCSGEGLPTELSHALLERLPDCRVHNLYGPTEASIDVSYWECQPSDRNDYLTTPIGKPIQNMRLYVLDEQLRPVPSHIPGELYISGVGLARGYINRNELTKKRFIASPFVVGERLYKTGDLAKWLPNGALEYLGRLDDQVKLRGFRIELGEIEAVISDHEGVRQGVVMVDRSGVHPRLVGYYVPSGPVDKEALHRHISERLPEYMVPCHLQSIDSVPLSSNGKLDRKSLPKVTISPEGSVYVSPETEEEKWLAEIWQDLLQIAKVGRHDNFFRLGGESLMAIKLISRLNDQFDIDCSVRTVFDYPELRQLASVVKNVVDEKNTYNAKHFEIEVF